MADPNDPPRAEVIEFRLPSGIDPDVALTRLRVVLRPRSSAGFVTVARHGAREGRLRLVDTDVERALLVLACASTRGRG